MKYLNFLLLALALVGGPVWAAEKININTASSAELQTLNGIGPVIAERIIDYREVNGPFAKIEDIKNVSGIGDAIFAKIKDFITVGDDEPPPVDTVPESGSAARDPLPSSESRSAHASQAAIARVNQVRNFAVSAGRERLASVHTPLEFRAVAEGWPEGRIRYDWSFGDGGRARGGRARHSYQFPGSYIVVVNAENGEATAAGRTTVEVVEPDLQFNYQAARGALEIINRGEAEINLGGWQFEGQTVKQILPPDTIIGPRRIITLPFDGPPRVAYPDGTVYQALSPVIAAPVVVAKLSSQSVSRATLIAVATPALTPSPPPPPNNLQDDGDEGGRLRERERGDAESAHPGRGAGGLPAGPARAHPRHQLGRPPGRQLGLREGRHRPPPFPPDGRST